jgi:hypothetical protein
MNSRGYAKFQLALKGEGRKREKEKTISSREPS